MWIAMTDSFLSVVAPPATLDPTGELLLVRARAKGDIARVFPGTEEHHLPGRDYAWRALIPRRDVGMAIAARLVATDYGNFKNAVPENDRHDAYAQMWSAMFAFQRRRGAPEARRERSLFDGRGRWIGDAADRDPMGAFPPYADEKPRPKRRRRVAKGKGAA